MTSRASPWRFSIREYVLKMSFWSTVEAPTAFVSIRVERPSSSRPACSDQRFDEIQLSVYHHFDSLLRNCSSLFERYLRHRIEQYVDFLGNRLKRPNSRRTTSPRIKLSTANCTALLAPQPNDHVDSGIRANMLIAPSYWGHQEQSRSILERADYRNAIRSLNEIELWRDGRENAEHQDALDGARYVGSWRI